MRRRPDPVEDGVGGGRRGPGEHLGGHSGPHREATAIWDQESFPRFVMQYLFSLGDWFL